MGSGQGETRAWSSPPHARGGPQSRPSQSSQGVPPHRGMSPSNLGRQQRAVPCERLWARHWEALRAARPRRFSLCPSPLRVPRSPVGQSATSGPERPALRTRARRAGALPSRPRCLKAPSDHNPPSPEGACRGLPAAAPGVGPPATRGTAGGSPVRPALCRVTVTPSSSADVTDSEPVHV